MPFESSTPVEEIAVIWACRPSYLDVTLDRSSAVLFKHMSLLISEGPARTGFHVPVFFNDPLLALGRMSAVGPPSQLLINQMVTARECFCSYSREGLFAHPRMIGLSVSMRSSCDADRNLSDVLADQCTTVLDGSLTWRDDGLETVVVFPGVSSCVRFAHGKLSDGEP